MGPAQDRGAGRREILRPEQPSPYGVVHIVVDVGEAVCEPSDLSLEGGRERHGPWVVEDPVAHLPGQVEPVAVVLQEVHHTQALLVVPEGPAQERGERFLAEMPEGGVAQIVAQRDRFGEVLVQTQGPSDRASDLGDLQGVGQSDPVVVTFRGHEDLRLVLETPKGLRVHDAVPIRVEDRTQRIGLFVTLPSLGLSGQGRSVGQDLSLDLLGTLANRLAGRPHRVTG